MPKITNKLVALSGRHLSQRGWAGVELGRQGKMKTKSPREVIGIAICQCLLITHEGKKVLCYDDLMKEKLVVLNRMYGLCRNLPDLRRTAKVIA